MQQLFHDFFIKIIDIENAELTLKALDRPYDVIRLCLVDCELILIHADLLDELHKRLDCKRIMLRRNAELLFYFLFHKTVFHQAVLLDHLPCVAKELLSPRRDQNTTVGS